MILLGLKTFSISSQPLVTVMAHPSIAAYVTNINLNRFVSHYSEDLRLEGTNLPLVMALFLPAITLA